MSKKNKSVLSIMLALMILLAPLSALHAKAENEKPYNDITRTYILTGEIKLTDGTILEFPEERHVVHEQTYPDGTLVNEEEYNSQMDQLGGFPEYNLENWAAEKGYNLGQTYIQSEITDENTVAHYYFSANNEEFDPNQAGYPSTDYYIVYKGTRETTYSLYYDASKPIYNYDLNYSNTYYPGSGDLNITFDAPEDTFTSLHVYASDGSEINLPENAFYYNHNDLVCINGQFLDTLGIGGYQFVLEFETLNRDAWIFITECTYTQYETELDYIKGVSHAKSITVEAPPDSLTKIEVEGVELDASGWSTSYADGRLNITLTNSLLEDLNLGANVLSLVFKGRESEPVKVTVNVRNGFYTDAEYNQPYYENIYNYVLIGEILLPDGNTLVFPEERYTVKDQAYSDGTRINENEYNEQMSQMGWGPQHLLDWAAQNGYDLGDAYVDYQSQSSKDIQYYFHNNEEIEQEDFEWDNDDYCCVNHTTWECTYHLHYDASEPIYNYTLSYNDRHLVGSGDIVISINAPENALQAVRVLDAGWNEIPLPEDAYHYNGSDQICFDASFIDTLSIDYHPFEFHFVTEKIDRYETAYITIADYSYEVTPTELNYSKVESTSLTFKVEAPENSLTKIEADGLDTTGKWSTTYSDGKLEVTLNSSLLEGLNAGTNVLTLVFANGTTRTVTVNARSEYYTDLEYRHIVRGEIVREDGSILTFDEYTHVVPYQCFSDGTMLNQEEYQQKNDEVPFVGEYFYNWAAEQGYPERDEVEVQREENYNIEYYYYNSKNEEISSDNCNWEAGDYQVEKGYIEFITYYRYKSHSYEVLEGEDSVHVQNSERGLTFVFDAASSSLQRVVIDNNTEMSSDSFPKYGEQLATVELNSWGEYLKNLEIGDHTITAYFSNGKSTTANFKVVPLGEGGEETLPREATEHVVNVTGEIIKLDGTVLTFEPVTYQYIEMKDADGYTVNSTETQQKNQEYWNLAMSCQKWAAENGYEGKGDYSGTVKHEEYNLYFNSKGEVITAEEYDPDNGDYVVLATREIRDLHFKYKESILDIPHDDYTYQAVPMYKNSADSYQRNTGWLRIDIDAPADSLTNISAEGIDITGGTWEQGFEDGRIWVTLYEDILGKLPEGGTVFHFTFVDGKKCSCTVNVTDSCSYNLLEGKSERVYIIHSGKTVSLNFDAPNTHAFDVYIDGEILRPGIMPSGLMVDNLMLELDSEVLDNLGEGEHKLVVKYRESQKTTETITLKVLYSYEILEGKENEYNAAEGGDVSVHIDGPLNMVQNVLVDGKVVDPSNYDLTEGSTIVTFHEDYLKTLANGEHTVQVEYKRYDGVEVDTAKATITVTQSTAEPTDDSSSETSDNSSAGESSKSESSDKDNSSKEDSQSGDSDKPKTGDAGVVAAACLLMVSLIGIAGAVVLKKKFAAEK